MLRKNLGSGVTQWRKGTKEPDAIHRMAFFTLLCTSF